jgi:hypothetical protein
MNLYQPTITGSLSVSGSINISGSITIAGGGTISGTASYATNAELLDGLDSTVFTLTSSFAAFTASQNILNGTYATTGSNTFKNPQTINSNLTVTGSITAQTLIVSTINATQSYSSGSNIFGNASSNTQTFTGSMYVTGAFYVTTGSVGIGTISPTNPLHILSNTVSQLNVAALSGNTNAQINLEPTGTGIALIGPANSVDFAFRTNATTRMTIGSTGKVGISTSVAGDVLLNVVNGSSTGYGMNISAASSSSNYALRVETYNGASSLFYVRGDGNVGIGTTSPTELLQLSKATYPFIKLTETTANTSGQFGYDSPTAEWRLRTLTSTPLTFGTNDTERMRILATGGVMIPSDVSGTSGYRINYTSADAGSRSWKIANDNLAYGDFYIGQSTTQSGSSYSVKLYINAAGNVLIGTTTDSGYKLRVSYNGSVTSLGVSASDGGVYLYTLGTGLVYSNGGVFTSTNPSDSRLKNNIQDISYGLKDILKLRPVSYNWVNDNINQGLQYGFIAQEVQDVMPDLVKEFTTKDGEDDVIRLGLEKEGIYATLVKAIQEMNTKSEEQQATITSLQEQITELKNK